MCYAALHTGMQNTIRGAAGGGGGWTGEEQEKREKKCQWTGWKVGVGRDKVKLEKVREKLNS